MYAIIQRTFLVPAIFHLATLSNDQCYVGTSVTPKTIQELSSLEVSAHDNYLVQYPHKILVEPPELMSHTRHMGPNLLSL